MDSSSAFGLNETTTRVKNGMPFPLLCMRATKWPADRMTLSWMSTQEAIPAMPGGSPTGFGPRMAMKVQTLGYLFFVSTLFGSVIAYSDSSTLSAHSSSSGGQVVPEQPSAENTNKVESALAEMVLVIVALRESEDAGLAPVD